MPGRQGFSTVTQSCRTVARSQSADLDSWLDSVRCELFVVSGANPGRSVAWRVKARFAFLLGGVKSLFLGISPPQEASSRTQQIEDLVEDSAGSPEFVVVPVRTWCAAWRYSRCGAHKQHGQNKSAVFRSQGQEALPREPSDFQISTPGAAEPDWLAAPARTRWWCTEDTLPGDVDQSDDFARHKRWWTRPEKSRQVEWLHHSGSWTSTLAATFPVTRGSTAKKGANGLRTKWLWGLNPHRWLNHRESRPLQPDTLRG